MNDARRRQRAAELAAVAVQLESQDVRKLAESLLPLMHEVLQRLEAKDHGELKERLLKVRELWRAETHAYVRKLERGVQARHELTQLHSVVANMRAQNAERALPRDVRIERACKRVLAKFGPVTHLAVAQELPDAS